MDSRSLEAVIGHALSRRVDHADLFFEYTTRDSVVLEEGIVKSGDRHLEQGLGVRAQAGERQGYAHSDEVSASSAMLAAAAARAISEGPASPGAVAVRALPWPGGKPFALTLTHDQDQSIRWERRLAALEG